jgi:hypothetical protein
MGKLVIVFRTIFRYSKWGKMSQIQSDTFGYRNSKKKPAPAAHIDNSQDKLDKKKDEDPKEPESTGKSGHVDLGTTILHAYRNLSPEQIGGMKRDTKELMELQKELMGTLAEMKPAIEQGAELLGTFSQFFGKPQS